MSATTSKKKRSFYVPQTRDFARKAVSGVSAKTEDGCTIAMALGDSLYQLSAPQADAIAQGLLMAAMRTSLYIANMPWDGGGLTKVLAFDGQREALRFSDDTIHGIGASFRFFGICWTYEGQGADPDYPANAVCIRTLHDGGILFGKGNAEYLLTAEQAYELYSCLTQCGYSLKTRSWLVWDKIIEWSTESGLKPENRTLEEQALLEHLKIYGRSSRRQRS